MFDFSDQSVERVKARHVASQRDEPRQGIPGPLQAAFISSADNDRVAFHQAFGEREANSRRPAGYDGYARVGFGGHAFSLSPKFYWTKSKLLGRPRQAMAGNDAHEFCEEDSGRRLCDEKDADQAYQRHAEGGEHFQET